MRVVSVGYIHLNRHPVTFRLEILQDARLRKLHAELWTSDTDVRIFTKAKGTKKRKIKEFYNFGNRLGRGNSFKGSIDYVLVKFGNNFKLHLFIVMLYLSECREGTFL